MPRRSRNSSKVAKASSSSIMVSDLTNSQILALPLASSSPRASRCTTITPEEIDEIATSLKNEFKTKVEQEFEEEKTKLLNLAKDVMSCKQLNRVATASDLKELKKVFTFLQNSSNEGNSRRATRTILENQTGLPPIPEEAHSPGNNVDCENVNEDDLPTSTTDFPASKTTGKAGKKLKIVSDKSDEEDENVFKKPTGRGKRTLKNSQLANGFQTPKMKPSYKMAVVTPGPNCHRPINVLRQPNPGEMAISMTGSPLLIATNNNIAKNVPQISIPLSDGRVMTVLADEGLDPDMSFCSDIDSETRERLAILQQLLSKKTRKMKD